MTGSAAEKAAGHPAEKEKMEKRRALGRGLESLLPGPRVMPAPGSGVRGQGPGASPTAGVQPVEEKQVPYGLTPVRNDNGVLDGSISDSAGELRAAGAFDSAQDTPAGSAVPAWDAAAHAIAGGEPFDGVIRAVVEEEVAELHSVGEKTSPLLPTPGRSGAPEAALRPAWAGEAPGPTHGGEGITIFAQAESRVPGNLVVNLAVGDIDKNPFQTRYVHHDEAMQELAESIKANGVVQPIVVRPGQKEGRYVLILGERRLTASRMLGRETIPAIVRRVSEQQAAEMTIIENLQREDLSPLEQAEAFRVLSEEFKMTQWQIGERIGLSRESVSNYMRLLRLPEETMKLLADGSISFATAKELLKIEDKELITKTAKYVVEHGLTFDQVEKLVWRTLDALDPIPGMPGQEKKKGAARWVDPNVRAAQTDLERLLGVRVRIRDRKGKGKIVIEYSTVDDYERVVAMLSGKRG